MEKYVNEAFQFTEKFVVWECKSDEEYGPVKNADGTNMRSTPATARRALFDLHKKYLLSAGATFSPPVGNSNLQQVEISPLLSYAGENLAHLAKGQVYTDQIVLIEPRRKNSHEKSFVDTFRASSKQQLKPSKHNHAQCSYP